MQILIKCLCDSGVNYISRYLASMDSGYAILFGSEGWQSLCERAADGSINDANDLASRINRYVLFNVYSFCSIIFCVL